MTAEDRAARLTAYALADPGLTPADRAAIEAELEADPAARAAVNETRELAAMLSAALAAEQAAIPAEKPVVLQAGRTPTSWKAYALAAGVFLAVFAAGGYYANRTASDDEFRRTSAALSLSPTPPPAGEPLADLTTAVDALDASLKPAEPGRGMFVRSTPKPSPAAGEGKPGGNAPEGYARGDIGKNEESLGQKPPGMKLAAPAPPTGPVAVASPPPADPDGGHPLPLATLPSPVPGSPDMRHYYMERKSERDDATNGTAGLQRKEGEQRGTLSAAAGRKNVLAYGEGRTADRYPALKENDFVAVEGVAALSTFGVDVDTASYSIVRKYLTMNQMPPADAVRLEELVNYFPYRDKAPEGKDPFTVTVEMADCPWQPNHRLARIAVKAKPIDNDKRPPSNLVFLIDVSGSMAPAERLPLVKASLRLLLNRLGENDRVALVVYAGASGLVLDSTSATKKQTILDALDRLEAGGSTNGGSGITQAYAVAAANFIKNGTNRVILCTDGDWNVGTTGTPELIKLIEEKRTSGVFLSVLGFGMGNLRDEMMVQLAGKGNGNYAYIDGIKEANKALVEQLGGTLVTVAKDVKIQIEFNPAAIQSYRLLGYEKRILAAQDFHDDTKDAGEMGAGHVVTALYELVPAGGAVPAKPGVDDLRYQPKAGAAAAPKAATADEAFVLKMRHKQPDGDVSTLREVPIPNKSIGYGKATEDFRFSAAVASFAMLLRDSPHKGNATYAAVSELADAARQHDPGAYRAEFAELVKKAKALSGKP